MDPRRGPFRSGRRDELSGRDGSHVLRRRTRRGQERIQYKGQVIKTKGKAM